jgi:hypothetical protein
MKLMTRFATIRMTPIKHNNPPIPNRILGIGLSRLGTAPLQISYDQTVQRSNLARKRKSAKIYRRQRQSILDQSPKPGMQPYNKTAN